MMTSSPSIAIHPPLAILWVGVTLAFLVVVFKATRMRLSDATTWLGVGTLAWLSAIGLLVLIAVSVTDLTAAYPLIDRNSAAVFITTSG